MNADGSVTIADNGSVTTSVNQIGKPHQLLLGGSADAYTLYDTMDKNYLTLTKSDNKLHVTTAANVKNAQWTISMNGGVTHIYNNGDDFLHFATGDKYTYCGLIVFDLYKMQTNIVHFRGLWCMDMTMPCIG